MRDGHHISITFRFLRQVFAANAWKRCAGSSIRMSFFEHASGPKLHSPKTASEACAIWRFRYAQNCATGMAKMTFGICFLYRNQIWACSKMRFRHTQNCALGMLKNDFLSTSKLAFRPCPIGGNPISLCITFEKQCTQPAATIWSRLGHSTYIAALV